MNKICSCVTFLLHLVRKTLKKHKNGSKKPLVSDKNDRFSVDFDFFQKIKVTQLQILNTFPGKTANRTVGMAM